MRGIMDLIKSIYGFLVAEAGVPKTLGLYHFICLTAVIALTVLVCKRFKDCSENTVNRLVAIVWIVIASLEVYKQIVFGLYLTDGSFTWDYAWYAFPFQFCSSPLYVLPFIAFSKNQRLRECCIAYMMTFSLFAGIAVFCYPNDVFTYIAGINLQTMVHHGSQILMGAFFAVRYRNKISLKFFRGGVYVFVVMVVVAMLLNIIAYHAFGVFGIDETFNMFFISPYFACTLPLLSIVWEKVPYLVFVCIYFFGFILCALLMHEIICGSVKGVRKITKRKISA